MSERSGAGSARLVLIRHPQTDWNSENRWQGHADPPLNARGVEQMREAYERLRAEPVAAIYSSDLLRAHEMATWLGVKFRLRPRITSALRERSMGEWDGRTPEEARTAWAELYAAVEADPLRVAPPGGESFSDVLRRVLPVLERIARLHPDETALIVTHGGVLKALVCSLLEVDLADREKLGISNAVHVTFAVEPPRWTILDPERLAGRQRVFEPLAALR